MFGYSHRSAKILSVSIAVLMTLSSVAGLLAAIMPASAASGDLTITGPFTIANTIYYVDGNVVVDSGGVLTIRNAELRILSDSSHRHSLTIQNFGLLNMDGGKITTYTDLVHPWPLLNMIVQSGADVVMKHDSVLAFPGSLIVRNPGSSIVMWDSNITRLPSSALAYLDTSILTVDQVDDGPAITVDTATFDMYNSSIDALPQGVERADLMLSGTAQLTAVNSFIGVNFVNPTASPLTYNKLNLSDHANAYLYGCVFAGPPAVPLGDSAVWGSTYRANSVPTAQYLTWDNSSQTLSNLWNEEGLVYQILPQRNMAVQTFNTTPITSSDIISVTLVLKFTATNNYAGNRPINYTLGGVTKSTGVIPVANDNRRVEVDMMSKGVDSFSDISSLRISFFNSGPTGTGNVQFDAVYLTVVTGPQTYVYRWGDMTVNDMFGVPLGGASISAKFNSSTWLGGQNVFYYTPAGISATPPANVLNYLGRTAGNYMLTDSRGKALIPYLTDIIDGHNDIDPLKIGTWPGSLSVGSLNITATSGAHSTSVDARFNPYPAMGSDDQKLSATVSISGVTATTWDSSKYLIVPPNLTLNGVYTHNGDVIAEPTGTLTLDHVNFAINRNPGETSNVTIYNGGTLDVLSSNFSSNQPVSLKVMSGGTLVISHSALSSQISITVHGGAVINIADSAIGGSFELASDATLTTEIVNTTFSMTPTFGGSSVVKLINVTAPAINQMDSSKVSLYRWVLVTVVDKNAFPLRGASVSARFQLDSDTTVRASGTSDSNGHVALKLLTTRMNASGGSVITNYFGNYLINATFTLNLVTYYANDVTLSLASYTTPLLRENPSITMTMPIAFADLTFGPNGISISPLLPTDGATTFVYADVTNEGGANATVAFDVSFYWNQVNPYHLIGTDTISSLNMGDTKTAIRQWDNTPINATSIIVCINPGRTVVERDYDNNNRTVSISVLSKPDLLVQAFYVVYNGSAVPSGGEVPADRNVIFHIDVLNQGASTVVSPVTVILYNGSVGLATRIVHANITQTIAQGQVVPVEFTLHLNPINVPSILRTYYAVVNPTLGQGGYHAPIPEADALADTNNQGVFAILVLDSRPDPMITASNIGLFVNTTEELRTHGNNISYATNLRILVTVVNDGIDGVNQVSVEVDINGTGVNRAIGVLYVDLNGSGIAGSIKTVEFTYRMTAFAGAYKINVTLDLLKTITNDKNRSNNNAYRTLNITLIEPVITLNPTVPANNVTTGTNLGISGNVNFPVTKDAMEQVTVTIVIKDLLGNNVSVVMTTLSANTSGFFIVNIPIRADLPSGTYNIAVTVGPKTVYKSIDIVAPGGITMILFLIIGLAIVAGVVIFSLYIYRQGVGKLVECGECGSLIPESAKKCPKCGVEFEEDMVKCSECGAWIAASSVECPNCHVRFGTPLEGEKTYEDKMMDQYEDSVLSKYRELAKGELGKKYTEESFQEWWIANPAYISFEDWLTKEEERRKQANLITCPVCGTPNASGSTVCHNCGSPLTGGGGEGAVERGQPGVVIEKRVIRKPIDRKIVPKKVIKKPLDQEQQGGQQQ